MCHTRVFTLVSSFIHFCIFSIYKKINSKRTIEKFMNKMLFMKVLMILRFKWYFNKTILNWKYCHLKVTEALYVLNNSVPLFALIYNYLLFVFILHLWLPSNELIQEKNTKGCFPKLFLAKLYIPCNVYIFPIYLQLK